MSAAKEDEDNYEEPWCQLISIEGRHEERIPIIEKRYIIGRNKGIQYICHGIQPTARSVI